MTLELARECAYATVSSTICGTKGSIMTLGNFKLLFIEHFLAMTAQMQRVHTITVLNLSRLS